jgi:hypothetical protein
MNRISFGVVAGVVGGFLATFGAVAVFPVWFFVMAFWFGCLWLQYRNGEPTMPRGLMIFHRIGTLTFPIFATLMKWRGARNGVFEDISIGNRVQHFTWALGTVALFAPLLGRWVVDRKWLEKHLIVVGFVALLGNLNEIGEWSRSLMNIDVAYRDTMLDLVMNLFGSALGAFILVRLCRPPSRAVQRPSQQIAHEATDGRVGSSSLV